MVGGRLVGEGAQLRAVNPCRPCRSTAAVEGALSGRLATHATASI
jgi:hypothetical protein